MWTPPADRALDLGVPCDRVPVVLAGAITIDASTDSNRYLEQMRRRYKESTSHRSNATAWANIQGASSAAVIVGHGDEGLVITGSGQTRTADPLRSISLTNQETWMSQIAGIGPQPISSLTLCACDTGAGERGADLLFALAEALAVPALAPTGIVFMGVGGPDPHLQLGAQWQEARPGFRPPKIEKPSYRPRPDMEEILLLDGLDFAPIRVGDVISVRVTPFDVAVRPLWLDATARMAVTFVGFDQPISPGSPAAVVTGEWTMTFVQGGLERDRSFVIYNNRLLQDRKAPEVLYYANIDQLLQTL